MNKICVALLAITLARGFEVSAQTSSITERMWAQDAATALLNLDDTLDESLPSLQQAVPGARPPNANAVKLAVALFSNGPGEPDGLGGQFTFLFKDRLAEAAGYALEMSPMWWEHYRRVVYAGEESFFLPAQDQELFLQRLRDRTGARFGLTGSVAEREGQLYTHLHLRDLRNDASVLQRDYQASADSLQTLMAEMIRDVLGTLDLEIVQPESLRREHPAALSTLRDILAVPCTGNDCRERRAHLRNLIRETPFPSAYILLAGSSPWSDPATLETLRQGLSRWPEHAMLRYTLAYHLPTGEKTNPNRERMQQTLELAARYPDFLEFQFHAVVELTWCCYNREALALARSLLERHPGHYRAWLVYTLAIHKYAWNIRGSSSWHNVPKRGQQQFPRLMRLSERAAEHTLSLNAYEPYAWLMHAINPPGSSERTRASLLRAIELDPHDIWAYEAGMLFFRRSWGGSVSEKMAFYHLAVKNNPSAQWPFDLHRSTRIPASQFRVRGAAAMNHLGCARSCRQYLGLGLVLLLLLSVPAGLLIWNRTR